MLNYDPNMDRTRLHEIEQQELQDMTKELLELEPNLLATIVGYLVFLVGRLESRVHELEMGKKQDD